MRRTILSVVILIYTCGAILGFADEGLKVDINNKQVEEISVEEERQQAILKRILSPDIYGREDPFAPITVSVTKPSTKGKLGLEGIIWDESQPLAIINGLIVSEGEMVNGKKVLKIEKQKVILEEGGNKITLEL